MRHLPVLIPILPLASAMLCLVLSRINKNLGKYVVLGALTVSLASSIGVFVTVIQSGETIHYYMGNWQPPLGIEFVIDQMNALILVAIAAVALFVGIYSQPFFSGKPKLAETDREESKFLDRDTWLEKGGFYALYALLSAGLLGMTITGDMFNLYVFLEIASISGYGLIALGGDKSVLASFRYLLLGTIAASFYLLAVAYMYSITGTLNMADMGMLLAAQKDSPNVLLAVSMLIIAFGIKMALFPLHGWQPDAYTYAHPAAAPLISGLMSKAPALAMLRYMFYIIGADSPYVAKALTVIGFLGACGIILGSVMANAQRDFRRMLAYSSVAQIGYIAVGLSLGNAYGIIAAVFHILIHAFMKSSLFMVIGAVRYRYDEVMIERLGGLNKHMPLTSVTLVIAALSMVGIPPTGGFFSKWYIIMGSLESGHYIYLAVLIASSLLNAVYFFRVIETVFINKDAELTEVRPAGPWKFELPLSMLVPIVLFGIIIIAIGVLNAPIVNDVLSLGLPEVLAI